MRRLLVGLATALLAAWTPASAAEIPSSWSAFRLNPQLNAVVRADVMPRWSVQTNGPISSSPTVANATVYVGTNRDQLFAIALDSGKVRWTSAASSPLMSAPLIDRGLVIVGEGNANSTTYVPRRQVVVGNGANGLMAFDAATGVRRWFVPLDGEAMPTGAIVDGTLVQHNGDGGIVAISPQTGALRWRAVPKSIDSMSAALPLGNGVVVTAGIYPNRVFAFSASDGHTIWSYDLSAADTGVGDCPPASDGRRIFGDYISPADAGGEAGVGAVGVERAYALDAASGRPLWNVALQRGIVPPRNEAAIPLVYAGSVFMGSAVAPYVQALDPATGAVRWRVKVRGPVKGGMVGIGGAVYFGDLAGNVWALSAADGHVRGVLHTGNPYNVGSPIVVGRSLVIGARNGVVQAIPLSTIARSGR